MVATVLAASAAQAVPASPIDYAKDERWLCLPGRADTCANGPATTDLLPGGYGKQSVARAKPEALIDCFAVHGTVSNDNGANADLSPGANEEKFAAEQLFARFTSSCRLFVPHYRSMTYATVTAGATGADVTKQGMIAYSDVAKSWKHYLAHHNDGRPFILIGSSQGSIMLQELIKREIEGQPASRRMKLAILPGFNVIVPQGKRVGGTFKSTPVCASPSETNCVMTWVSFREKNPPPAGAIFGYAPTAGTTVACTNPARPGSSNWVELDSIFYARSTLPVPGGPISWSSDGKPPTAYVRTPGLVSARCVNGGQRGYLEIRTNADPKDKRTDRIGGEVGVFGMFIPGWGMHLADMAVAHGDLVRRVDALGDQSVQAQGRER